MNLIFQYDYLKVAVEELKRAIYWRDLARDPSRGNRDPKWVAGARSVMRHHALRSRKAFNGELLQAN